MPGRLIAVVGPSGVGKDTLMGALASADPSFGLVRRVITRPSSAGGEDFEGVSEDRFTEMARAGAFCLSWSAHGLRYGIPTSVQDDIKAGRHMLINLSRAVLGQAHDAFDNFAVLNVTASADVLRKRLIARGRESAQEVERRLARKPEPFPARLQVVTIANDGPLSETVAKALSLLQAESA